MRRWEKVLFARRYRQLAEAIESARTRLNDARERRSGGVRRGWPKSKPNWGASASSWRKPSTRRRTAREAAHARELEINRRQQQIALDTQQAEMLETRAASSTPSG